MCEYSISDQGKSIDIVVKLNEKKYAIELKYRACRSKSETQFEKSKEFGRYRITRACNMYEYTDDIKSRILNESIRREFENVYAIILTNHSTFHNEQSIRNYRRKRIKEDTELSSKECDNVNFEPIEIEDGYYNEYNKNHKDKKFKIMCASIKK